MTKPTQLQHRPIASWTKPNTNVPPYNMNRFRTGSWLFIFSIMDLSVTLLFNILCEISLLHTILMMTLICFSGDRCVQQRIHSSGDTLWPPTGRNLHQRQCSQAGQQKILLEGKDSPPTYACISSSVILFQQEKVSNPD